MAKAHEANLARIPSGDAKQYQIAVNVTNLAHRLIAPNRHFFPTGSRVLDIGAGDGYATEKLIANCPGIEVTAVDFSPSMVAATKAKHIPGIVDVVQADAGNLPPELRQGQFDAIFSLSTLHWVKNFRGLNKGMSEALAPGGKLVAEFAYKSPKEIKAAIMSVVRKEFGEHVAYAVGNSDPWQETHSKKWRDALKANHFEKDSIEIAPVVRHQSLTGEQGMHEWLKMFATPFLKHIPEERHAEILEKTATELKKPKYHLYNPNDKENPWHVDYYRYNVTAEKQHSR